MNIRTISVKRKRVDKSTTLVCTSMILFCANHNTIRDYQIRLIEKRLFLFESAHCWTLVPLFVPQLRLLHFFTPIRLSSYNYIKCIYKTSAGSLQIADLLRKVQRRIVGTYCNVVGAGPLYFSPPHL